VQSDSTVGGHSGLHMPTIRALMSTRRYRRLHRDRVLCVRGTVSVTNARNTSATIAVMINDLPWPRLPLIDSLVNG